MRFDQTAPAGEPRPEDLANGGTGVQSELPLHLQRLRSRGLVAIVVWLYGSASYLGAGHLGSYNGTSNAKNGVITVPINYRLGGAWHLRPPYPHQGRGSTERAFALMDAVAALEWVKRKRAAAFGGDPNNITLAGQSAGAAMVVNLLSVPSARVFMPRPSLKAAPCSRRRRNSRTLKPRASRPPRRLASARRRRLRSCARSRPRRWWPTPLRSAASARRSTASSRPRRRSTPSTPETRSTFR